MPVSFIISTYLICVSNTQLYKIVIYIFYMTAATSLWLTDLAIWKIWYFLDFLSSISGQWNLWLEHLLFIEYQTVLCHFKIIFYLYIGCIVIVTLCHRCVKICTGSSRKWLSSFFIPPINHLNIHFNIHHKKNE